MQLAFESTSYILALTFCEHLYTLYCKYDQPSFNNNDIVQLHLHTYLYVVEVKLTCDLFATRRRVCNRVFIQHQALIYVRGSLFYIVSVRASSLSMGYFINECAMYVCIVQADLSEYEQKCLHDPAYSKYVHYGQLTRAKHRLSGRSQPYTSQDIIMRGVPQTPRILDWLDIAWGIRRDAMPGTPESEFLTDVFGNLSQAIQRNPTSVGVLPCLLTSSYIYSFEKKTMISSHAHLRTMGVPKYTAPKDLFSASNLRDLGGEIISIQLLALITSAIFTTPSEDWWISPSKIVVSSGADSEAASSDSH
jgi:hypothetical protein